MQTAAPPAPTRVGPNAGPSWLGLTGGLTGFLPLLFIAVAVFIDPPEDGIWPGLALLAMSLVYLPAVWASIAATSRRRTVLRGTLIVSLVVIFLASPFFGTVLAIILAVPTGLLALAGGFVFQGPPRRR